MTRLIKRCFVLSVGLHLLVVAVLIICATYLFAEKPKEIQQKISLIAPEVLDNILNPSQPAPPSSQPPMPVRPVRPVKPNPPTPVKPAVKPNPPRPIKTVRPDPPRPVKPKQKPRPQPQPKPKAKTPAKPRPNIKISSNTKTSNNTSQSKQKTTPRPSVSKNDLDNIRKASQQLSAAIQVNVTGSNRAAFASYAAYVVGVYRGVWQPLIPRNLSRSQVAQVTVTIRRDGTVLSARITRRTGNAALDRSVQTALNRVKRIGKAFPSGSRDTQRTFVLDFTPRLRN